MARDDILEKLKLFLNKHCPFSEECHVVYLMVSIRKILDHERINGSNNKYQLIRFYCDWVVHIEKDHITDEMCKLINEIYIDIKSQIENPFSVKKGSATSRFAYMNNLQNEMESFLRDRNLDTKFIEDDNWIQFIQLLVKILENQPINNPTKELRTFSFIPAADRCVQYRAIFKNPIGKYAYYDFGNAY